MVARSPPKQKKKVVTAAAAVALNPLLIRETLKKVDQCMVRLQELQYTVTGGTKLVSGVNLSPRSTRSYLRTSLRCKQESLRINNGVPRRSPTGKFPRAANSGEWRRMSLPAMLVGETVGEILQASQFAREIVSTISKKPTTEDPKTPLSSSQRPCNKVAVNPENTELKARRKKEKQIKLQSDSPPLQTQRARSRINFKVSPLKVSPPKVRKEFDKESKNYLANRVSPRNKPWASKTVLFPNPLFLSTTTTSAPSFSSKQQQICKTKSPVISRNRGTTTAHKFLIKSPPTSATKFQVKVKSPPAIVSVSPTRRAATSLSKSSPKRMAASSSSSSKWIRPFSPSRLAKGLASPLKKSRKNKVQKSYEVFVSSSNGHAISSPKNSSSSTTTTASKLRRSFSPSRLASRLVSLSPLKSRKTINDDGFVSGLKQRPVKTTVQFPPQRI